MKRLKRFLLASILSLLGLSYLSIFSVASAQSVYNSVLDQTTDSQSLSSALKWDIVTDGKGSDLFNNQVILVIGYAIDIFIVIWIAVAFIGGYKIMTSDKEESLKEWIRFVIFGIIGIIIMVSARFLAEWLVWSSGLITEEFGSPTVSNQPNWIDLASNLYNKILYPFIKVTLYLVIGFLFFMMAAKVVSFVTSTDDSAKKKAGWVIIRSVIWILIVMWSKQLVEAVMWNQDKVLNNQKATWISWWDTWIGEEMLDFGSIPLIAQIINWVMWLTMFIILVLIIIQGYKMFTKPDDPKNRESLKKTLLYIIIWVLVIWAAYAISNVLIVNQVPITQE